MGQGKRDSQMKDAENVSFWGVVFIFIMIILIAIFG